ncbi:hypothetical protein EPUS_00080 [Endocarpon pusillum Z07020]|uniref:Uncharacterized protein n=1 Tax=Endocarpon pusillum (strain Z07020 / HMAS-L-300199) TaxID=1263415 RepID=U1GSD2_ENDPU|nr:uncharacterized protein EPUS_00080 [Endocarpon pusillum Z07020]ERF75288.1 hypothetical protein EPUS_00080 [Endocarpon pusillum Z07020]
MTLVAYAEKAEDIAEALSKFKTHVPDHAADITASIAELYAIGSHLRAIDSARNSAEFHGNFPLIEKDLRLVCSSLDNTVEDVFDILGYLGNGSPVPNAGMYRQNWKDIYYFFMQNGRVALTMRLEIYRRFIAELASIMKRFVPTTKAISLFVLIIRRTQGLLLLGDLRDEIQALLPAQPRLMEGGNQMSLHPRCAEHWAMKVFLDTSTTPFNRTGNGSRCYGEHTPEARARLEVDYQDILEITFSGQSELTVRLYCREGDHRARILCKWPRGSGGSKYSCLPLNLLEFHRSESSLQICMKRHGSSRLDLWANLNFSTIERLVIFHCTLLSLRGHDACKPVTNIQDYELAGEKEYFTGKIIDDDYLHALRIYRDRDTKAVRLHASVHRGEMKRTPVWTAFITHYLLSRTWLRRAGRTLVYIRELRRHVFSSEYMPHMTGRGEHVLKFTSEGDTDAFMSTIYDLGEPPPPHARVQPPPQP